MSLDRLIYMLEQYQPYDQVDRDHWHAIRDFVLSHNNCLERSNRTGHLTASCWIVNSKDSSVALVLHRKLERWLQPGGHADGESDLLAVALREAQEETGLTDLQVISDQIFDVDVHRIPARGSEPEHLHFDVRFVLCADSKNQALRLSDESRAVAWCPLSQFDQMRAEESLMRMRSKWLRMNQKGATQSTFPLVLKRNYQRQVSSRICSLKRFSQVSVEQLGELKALDKSFELYRIESSPYREALPSILIVAGIHGDEPAAVEAALQFAENKISQYAEQFNFVIYPCLNPSGFEEDTRHNYRGADLNRQYSENSEHEEARLILASLKSDSRQFVFSLDLHEDNPFIFDDRCSNFITPTAFYLYESCLLGSLRFGEKITRRLGAQEVEICDDPEIYGDKNFNGVVRYGEGSDNKTYIGLNKLDEWLIRSKTNLCFQMETPLGWSYQRRVDAHLKAIEAALAAWKESQLETFVGGGL